MHIKRGKRTSLFSSKSPEPVKPSLYRSSAEVASTISVRTGKSRSNLFLRDKIEKFPVKVTKVNPSDLKDFLDELEACESEFQYLSAQELSHLGLDKEAEKLYLKAFNLRPEQQQFRQALLKVYRRCAVTGCRIESVLDAAHIVPHSKTRNNDITNGLILRVDIHRLFDDCLIAIHPQTLQVHVSPELEETEYFGFQGCVITVPTNTEYQPDKIALKWQWNRCSWNISRD